MLRRILVFGSAPLLSMVAPLLVLPVVADHATVAEWAALALGQSIGGLASIVIAFGWPMRGPVEVAEATRADVASLYTESLLSRAAVAIAVLGPVVGVAAVVAPPGTVGLTVGTACATALSGLSASWVAIGLGRGALLVLCDALPRVLLTATAIIPVGMGAGVGWYPAFIALGSMVALVVFSVVVRPGRVSGAPVAVTLRRLRTQASAAATTMVGSVYSTGALLLVGLSTSVQETAAVASADRLYRFGLFAVLALTNALQAWVVHADPAVAASRRRRALQAHVVLGVVGGLGFAVLGPHTARLLFGDDVAPSAVVTAWYGLAYAMVAISSSLGQHFLVPAGRVRDALRATLVGAVVGVPLVMFLGHFFRGPGAAAGLMLTETAVAAVAAHRVYRGRRGRRGMPGTDGEGLRSGLEEARDVRR